MPRRSRFLILALRSLECDDFVALPSTKSTDDDGLLSRSLSDLLLDTLRVRERLLTGLLSEPINFGSSDMIFETKCRSWSTVVQIDALCDSQTRFFDEKTKESSLDELFGLSPISSRGGMEWYVILRRAK